MLSEIDTQDFIEWQGFYQLEPWGEEWMRTAFICSAVEAAFGGGKFEPKKYLPVREPEVEQTPEQIEAFFMGLAKVHK
jgi:hypothetical protein